MGRDRVVRIVLLSVIAIGSGACARDSSSMAESVQVADSAGIRLVRNTGAAWGPGDAWLVDAEPEWVLGTLEGPPETRFFRVGDVVWREDGGILVADGGSAEIRAFDAGGRYLWSQGGEGDGPGEYRSPAVLLALSGDSAAVYDNRARRVSVLTGDGEFVRSVTPELPEGYSMAAPQVAVGADLWVSSGGVRFGGDGPPSGTIAPPMAYFRARPDGRVLDSILSLPTGARLIQQSGEGIGVWTVPFSPGPSIAGGGGRLVTARATVPAWTARDSTGRVVQVVSFPAEGRRITDEDWAAALQAALPEDADPGRRQAVTAAYEAMDRPGEMPILQNVLLDTEGRVWVEGFQPPGSEEEPSRWWIFTEEGRLLGQLSMPAGLEVHAVDRDRIVGVAKDALGVERIQLHRIRRPG